VKRKLDPGPPRRFDQELGTAEFEDLRRTRRAHAGCGVLVAVLLVAAGLVWFFIKVLPDMKRRQAARAAADTWEPPPKTPFVKGIDYDVPQPDEDDDGD